MSYVIAILDDDTFAERQVVIGVSEKQVVTALALYLTAAKPMTPMGRLEFELVEHPTCEWLNEEVLADVEDIRVQFYSTEDGSLLPAGAFVEWTAHNREALERQHAPYSVDVIPSL